jgi:histidinol-phosphate/aromatic aminotransferase/cobyric acid decarboxylase-like protein
MLSQGIDIGRPNPPHVNWSRISVGLPEENQRSQDAIRRTLEETAPNNSSAAK